MILLAEQDSKVAIQEMHRFSFHSEAARSFYSHLQQQ